MKPQPQPQPLPAEPPALVILRECLDVSPCTISHLINSRAFDEVIAVRFSWISYLVNHSAETAACRDWSEAWRLFWETSHAD